MPQECVHLASSGVIWRHLASSGVTWGLPTPPKWSRSVTHIKSICAIETAAPVTDGDDDPELNFPQPLPRGRVRQRDKLAGTGRCERRGNSVEEEEACAQDDTRVTLVGRDLAALRVHPPLPGTRPRVSQGQPPNCLRPNHVCLHPQHTHQLRRSMPRMAMHGEAMLGCLISAAIAHRSSRAHTSPNFSRLGPLHCRMHKCAILSIAALPLQYYVLDVPCKPLRRDTHVFMLSPCVLKLDPSSCIRPTALETSRQRYPNSSATQTSRSGQWKCSCSASKRQELTVPQS